MSFRKTFQNSFKISDRSYKLASMGEPKQIYSIWTSNFNPRIIECILFPKIGEKRVKILKKKREHANAKNKSPKFFNTHWNGSAERKKKKKERMGQWQRRTRVDKYLITDG